MKNYFELRKVTKQLRKVMKITNELRKSYERVTKSYEKLQTSYRERFRSFILRNPGNNGLPITIFTGMVNKNTQRTRAGLGGS